MPSTLERFNYLVIGWRVSSVGPFWPCLLDCWGCRLPPESPLPLPDKRPPESVNGSFFDPYFLNSPYGQVWNWSWKNVLLNVKTMLSLWATWHHAHQSPASHEAVSSSSWHHQVQKVVILVKQKSLLARHVFMFPGVFWHTKYAPEAAQSLPLPLTRIAEHPGNRDQEFVIWIFTSSTYFCLIQFGGNKIAAMNWVWGCCFIIVLILFCEFCGHSDLTLNLQTGLVLLSHEVKLTQRQEAGHLPIDSNPKP